MQVSTRFYYGDQYDLYDLAKVQPELNLILDPKTPFYYKPQNLISFTLNDNYAQPITKKTYS